MPVFQIGEEFRNTLYKEVIPGIHHAFIFLDATICGHKYLTESNRCSLTEQMAEKAKQLICQEIDLQKNALVSKIKSGL